MSGGFGFSVGDIVLLSKFCLTVYQACSDGRKSAPAVVTDLSNELWSLSSALDQLAAASSKPGSSFESYGVKETTANIISNCRTYLEDLQTLLQKYGMFSQGGSPSRCGFQWIRKLRCGMRKTQWTFEIGQIEEYRSKVGSNMRAVTLLVNVVQWSVLIDL